MWRAEAGFCQFINTESYKRAYWENEEFVSWGPEDAERFLRFYKLGYKVGRLAGRVYHLEHSRGADSGSENPQMTANLELWEDLKAMNCEELNSYYKNTQYFKDRTAKQNIDPNAWPTFIEGD